MSEHINESGSTEPLLPSDEIDQADEAAERELGTEQATTDPVAEVGQRELGTETKHEIRKDGSIAYFGDDAETDEDRERAQQGIPSRERGTSTGGI